MDDDDLDNRPPIKTMPATLTTFRHVSTPSQADALERHWYSPLPADTMRSS